MSQSWAGKPEFKIEVGSITITNDQAISMEIVNPENNVSFAVLNVNDYRSKNFQDIFNVFTSIIISLRYSSESWTKVFSGTISTVKPKLSTSGEVLEVSAWGTGWALVKTHCNTSYGVESKNPTINLPYEIWYDLVDNYINKSFGGSATGYSFTKDYISSGIVNPNITFIDCAYKSCFDIINLVCDLRNSWTSQQSPVLKSAHWIVSPTDVLHIKTIGASQTGWTAYWKDSQELSTLEITRDMILYDFQNNIEEYANKIVLLTNLRKPGSDYLTENGATNNLWGYDPTEGTVTDDATFKIVGSNSLKLTSFSAAGISGISAWYPSTSDAAWDFTKVESPDNPPSIDFYIARAGAFTNCNVWMETSSGNGFVTLLTSTEIPETNAFVHLSLPFGTYYSRREKSNFRWIEYGSGYGWNNINRIRFALTHNVNSTGSLWIDDSHFLGKIIREAYDSTAISNNDEYQRVIRNDTAIDDTMKQDDSGTAARLTYAELIRRKQVPTVAIIQIPIAPDILPGQLVHIHAAKKVDGTLRIDKDFRIKEVRHFIGFPCKTTLNMTDDLYNSHAFAAPTAYSLLAEYVGALGHAEAKNLKGSGIDIEIPRLSKDYPS